MKTRLFIFGLLIAAIGLFSSCEENRGGSASGMKFKRMNIAGAKAIALASDGGDQNKAPGRIKADGDEPQYNISNPVWIVSEDGTLVEVHYTIEVEGNGEIVDMVKANMRLKMQYIYPIGDDWLWLVNCEYDYPGLDDIPEPLHGKIRELMNSAGIDLNFLVRKSDGALFQWTREQGCPERGRGYWRPSDVYGEVEAVGKDLFTSPCMGGVDDYYGNIYKLEAEGDVLNVRRVLSSTQSGGFLLPDKRGFIGTYLFYGKESSGFDGNLAVTLDPTSLALSNISTGDVKLDAKGFVNIDGTNYLLGVTDMYGADCKYYLFEMENQMGMWMPKTPALMEWTPNWQGDWSAMPSCQRPYKSAVATWWSSGYIYTLDPKAKTITKKALPDRYPSNEDSYYDGVAYVLSENQDGFYVCDLSKDAAEFVEFVYDQSMVPYVSQIAMFLGYGRYDPSTQCFSGSAQLLDGTYIILIVDAQGENRGKVRVLHEGESDAGKVISVMVRLN